MSTAIADLVSALDQEAQSHHERYLELARRAGEMGYPQAAKLFRAIVAAETARVGLYRESLAHLYSAVETEDYYVCPKCGVAISQAPLEQCPLCGTPGSRFERID